MDKQKTIKILSYLIPIGFVFYLVLRDGFSEINILMLILLPLYVGFVESILRAVVAPETVPNEADRYGDIGE